MAKPDGSIFGKAEMIYRQRRERGTEQPHVVPGSIFCSPLPVPVTLNLFLIDPLHFSPVLLSACSLKASLGMNSAAAELHMCSSCVRLLPLPLLHVRAHCIFRVGTQSEALPPLTALCVWENTENVHHECWSYHNRIPGFLSVKAWTCDQETLRWQLMGWMCI